MNGEEGIDPAAATQGAPGGTTRSVSADACSDVLTDYLVSPGILCLIQLAICLAQRLVHGEPPDIDDAETGAYKERYLPRQRLLAHLQTKPFQSLEQHGNGAVGHHQGKFFTTESGYHGIREELGEQPGQVTEQLIADGVPPVIIDLLGVIHIEHAQGELRLMALILLEPLLTLVEPVASVVKSGQVVSVGRFLDVVELLKGLQVVADPALQLLGFNGLIEKIIRPLLELACP